MEYFPEDVLMPIFLRLPGKSLIRFKCLSKLWSLVFTDPKFNRMLISLQNHKDFILQYEGLYPELSRLRIDTSFTGCGESLKAKDIECPLQVKLDEILGIAHCDGILCMFIENIKEDDGTNSAVVWNPMTKEHKRFMLTGFSRWEAFGFGYDSVIDDYKVIHIKGSRPRLGELQWRNIHSIRLKKAGIEDWNAALNNVPYCFTISTENRLAMAVNGCLYWIGSKRDDFGDISCYVILCFDLGKEILKEETSLCGEGIFSEAGKSSRGMLGLLGNSLSLSLTNYYFVYTDLLVMEENEVTKAKYWIKLMRIMRTGLEKRVRYSPGYPIFVSRNGQILTNEFSKKELFLFSQDGSVKKIAIRGLRLLPSDFFHVIPYVESLVSPTA